MSELDADAAIARVGRARSLATLLDSAVRVPGTGIRLGLDPLLGLVPGLGDLAGAVLSGYIVLLGAQLGAPASVVARMLGNVVVDTVGGSLPLIGDLFDVAWKSNAMNVDLLERWVGEPTRTRRASRWLIGLTVLALALVAAGGVALAVVVIKMVWVTLRS